MSRYKLTSITALNESAYRSRHCPTDDEPMIGPLTVITMMRKPKPWSSSTSPLILRPLDMSFSFPRALICAALLGYKRFKNIIWAKGDSTPSKVPRHLTQTDDQLDIISGRRSLRRIHHLEEPGNASRPARFNIRILVTHQ